MPDTTMVPQGSQGFAPRLHGNPADEQASFAPDLRNIGQVAAPAPEPVEDPRRSAWSDIPLSILYGAYDAGQAMGELLFGNPIPKPYAVVGPDGSQTFLQVSSPTFDPRLNPTEFQSDTVAGAFLRPVSQFVTGLLVTRRIPLGRLPGISNMTTAARAAAPTTTKWVGRALMGGTADVVAFSPTQQRLGDLLASLDPNGTLGALGSLTARGEEDGELPIVGRAFNFIEGAILGIGFETFISAARAIRGTLRSSKKAVDPSLGRVASQDAPPRELDELLNGLERSVEEFNHFHSPTLRRELGTRFPSIPEADRNILASLAERFAVMYRGAANGEDGIKAWFRQESVDTLTTSRGRPAMGLTDFTKEALPIIRLSREADEATFFHEVAHLIRRSLNAPDRVLANEAVGAIGDAKWTRAQEEMFVDQFVRYVRRDPKGAKGFPEVQRGLFGRLAVIMNESLRIRKGVEGSLPTPRAIKPEFERLFNDIRSAVEGEPDRVVSGSSVDALASPQKPRSAPEGTQGTPSEVRPEIPLPRTEATGATPRAIADANGNPIPTVKGTEDVLKDLGLTDQDLRQILRDADTNPALVDRAWINNPRLDLTDGDVAWKMSHAVQNFLVAHGKVSQAAALPNSVVVKEALTDLGMSNDVLAGIQMAKLGQAENLAVVVRLRNALRQKATDLGEALERNVFSRKDLSSLSDEALGDLLAPYVREFSEYVHLQSTVSDIGTAAGRLLQIHKVVATLPDFKGMTADQIAAKMKARPGSSDILYELTGRKPQKMLQDLRRFRDEQVAGKTLDKLREADARWHNRTKSVVQYFRNAVLSGPRTLLVNYVNTAAQGWLKPAMDFMGASVLRLSRNADKTAALQARKALAELNGNMERSVSMIFGGNGYQQRVWGLMQEARRSGRSIFDTSVFDDAVLDGVSGKGWLLKYPQAIMAMTDEMQKIQLFLSDSYARKFTELIDTGMRTADADRAAREWADRGLTRLEQLARDKTLDQNMANTLRFHLEDEYGASILRGQELAYTAKMSTKDRRAIIKLAAVTQKVVQEHPSLGVILPFIRTPALILQDLVETTPILGLFTHIGRTHLLPALRTGDVFAVEQAAKLVGKQMFGATLMASIWAAKEMGIIDITGAEPRDAEERAAWRSAGKQPWSIRVGGVWIGIQALDPFSAILAPLATLLDNLDRGQPAIDATAEAVWSLSQVTMDRAFFTGISRFLAAIKDPKQFGNLVADTAGSFIPFSSLLRAGTNTVYGLQGEMMDTRTRTVGERFWNQIAGRSFGMLDMPVYKALDGGDIPRWALNPLFPIPMSWDRSNDPTIKEILRIPGGLSTEVGFQMEGVTLTAAQRADINNRLVTIEIGGKTLKQRLDEIVASPRYQNAVDLDILWSHPETRSVHPRYTMIRDVVTRYRLAARSAFTRSDPSFQESRQEVRQLRQDVRSPRVGILD